MNEKMTRKRPERQGLSRDLTSKIAPGALVSTGLSKNRRRRLNIGEPGVSDFGGFACHAGIAPHRWKEKPF
jgi:hypothetical protein